MKPLFIAEVKTCSPFGFKDLDHNKLLDIALRYGDMVAIHTDERWGGSFGAISSAKDMMRRYAR